MRSRGIPNLSSRRQNPAKQVVPAPDNVFRPGPPSRWQGRLAQGVRRISADRLHCERDMLRQFPAPQSLPQMRWPTEITRGIDSLRTATAIATSLAQQPWPFREP
jgi:hypothetical protein